MCVVELSASDRDSWQFFVDKAMLFKIKGTAGLSEQLSASQEGYCFINFVIYLFIFCYTKNILSKLRNLLLSSLLFL
jgi:hypothetical protein